MKKFFSSIWSFLKSAPSRVWKFSMRHKIISIIIVLVIIGAGYFAYTAIAAAASGTEYVLSSVTRGPLVVTVTGSGQVDADTTLNVTPQGSASGEILQLNVTPGQAVTAGQVIAQLDSTTADEAVTSAKQDLESAQISYQQTLTSSGSSVTSDQNTVSTDQTNNLNSLQTNYTDLPTIMTGLDGILHDISTISEFTAQENLTAYSNFIPTAQSQAYAQQVQADYVAANTAYQNAKAEYVNDDTSTITEAQLQQLDTDTITANQSVETALKDTLAYFNYLSAQIEAAKITRTTQLSSQISSLTSYQSTLTSDTSSITSAQTALINAQNTLTADTESLNSSDSSQPLTVQTAELNVEKAQESLSEAETTASYYTVVAPFSGTIGSVPVNQYDQASSGTTIATLITNDDYVDLSLNEADAAKVQVGQAVSLTFDALPNLTVAGNVATIDPVGTVSSGVDTYDVRISLASQNSSIKPGMTAEAVITVASSTNAIQVPSAAIKTSGNSSYVEVATLLNASSTLAKMSTSASGTGTHRTRTASSTSAYGGFGGGAFASSSMSTSSGMLGTSATTPMISRSLTVPASEVKIKNVTITTGLSNDTMTQILSGLTPGEFIVTATESATTNTTKSAAASATSLLGGTTGRTGLGGAGGGYTGGGGGARTGGATGGAAAGR